MEPDAEFRAVVAQLLAVDEQGVTYAPVSGGVSSDIWRVDVGGASYCAKRALPRLKVSARWEVPVSRNAEEVRWLNTARRWIGDSAARVVASDEAAGIAVLEWYDPDRWHTWKQELLHGRVRLECARRLGQVLGTLSAHSAAEPALARVFANDALFDALRVDPFFRYIADRYPSLHNLIRSLTTDHGTLVHGDFSPKNVLVDDNAEVRILDAECACWGNPGFDPGYLLAHLLLKHLHTGQDDLRNAAHLFWEAYLREAGHCFSGLDTIVVQVVGGMLLARVDGKSPVEYLTPAQADQARQRGLGLLAEPPPTVAALLSNWH